MNRNLAEFMILERDSRKLDLMGMDCWVFGEEIIVVRWLTSGHSVVLAGIFSHTQYGTESMLGYEHAEFKGDGHPQSSTKTTDIFM